MLGITYKDGVLLASDTLGVGLRLLSGHVVLPAHLPLCCCCVASLISSCQRRRPLPCTRPPCASHHSPLSGSYGSTKRYKSFERLRKVNDVCVVGASGELSDFQYIMRWAACGGC